jgi:hypothetical protein
MTQEYVLRAMATNYARGHCWDHLDGETCRKAADEIKALRSPEGREWRCFHCDEVFTDEVTAKDHFGYDMLAEPGCKLNQIEGGLLGILRRQEDRLDAYHREDTASYREFYSLGADHSQALRREEEKGYARGLADARAAPATQPRPVPGGVREALEFYADPFAWKKKHDPGDDVRVPDFYSETSFGDTAVAALASLDVQEAGTLAGDSQDRGQS